MYASINNKPFKGKACNFTPYWVKAAQRDGFRSVIYYQVDSGKRFKGPYVAAFSADYSSLHLVGRKIYNADHCVRRKFNTAALDCGCNNFLSFTICITLSTFFQFFKPETYQMVRFGFYFGQQEVPCLFTCKLGDLFEIGDQFLFLNGELVQFFLRLFMFLDSSSSLRLMLSIFLSRFSSFCSRRLSER